jgi:hypothetical protein
VIRGGYDLLLEWISETGAGTWEEFRKACDYVQRDRRPTDPAERAWHIAASLSALGHLEISWREGRWAVAPPVLTMLPNSGGRALLTGARTRALYWTSRHLGEESTGALADAAQRLDLWIDEHRPPKAPTSVMVACNEPDDAEDLAAECRIAYSYSVSDQLSAMLPPLEAYERFREPGGLPQGFEVSRYDTDALEWVSCDPQAAETTPGLYRSSTWTDQVHVLVLPGLSSWRVPRDFGVFEVLRWDGRAVLVYDSDAMELWVPSFARLPLLHERAAVLSTGQLPQPRTLHAADGWEYYGHYYMNVKREIADRIASSLSQELEVR